jgi:hypothetical protein
MVSDPQLPAAMAFRQAAERLVEVLPPTTDEHCAGRIAKLLEQLAVTEPETVSVTSHSVDT